MCGKQNCWKNSCYTKERYVLTRKSNLALYTCPRSQERALNRCKREGEIGTERENRAKYLLLISFNNNGEGNIIVAG